ncbi:alpha-tubulin N-acetyltransferase-like [Ischnura elegans]|uniref:alpha-tubulin N-acetyltransferase-like n=1 Tax=Ischnura elegans TaxID=197161 RepID=UPI001ED893F0|nr:alpha-tubulin N-acetyltransferase-like [Ischnura elegans]
MEFPFVVNDFLQYEITRIDNTLLPEGFTGDRRTVWSCQENISTILDAMGKASASAQGLNVAITTGDRLKNSDQIVYLLIDRNGKDGKGTVVGMLKTGRKKLYVFDQSGAHHEIIPQCILDFYVHESKQRMGCGKKLFDYMLQKENLSPGQLAIDRPSEKFIAFLYKHYGLEKIIPQMNNFVVFDVFFKYISDSPSHSRNTNNSSEAKHVHSPKAGITNSSCSSSSRESESRQRVPEQFTWKAPILAQRPVSSIGQILQHTANLATSQPLSTSNQDPQNQLKSILEPDVQLSISKEGTPHSSREHSPILPRDSESRIVIPKSEDFVPENPHATSTSNGDNEFQEKLLTTVTSKTPEMVRKEVEVENIQPTNASAVNCSQQVVDTDPHSVVKRDLKFHHEPLW